MAVCQKCLNDVGCSCNLDVNLLCTNCTLNQIKKEIPIVNKSNRDSNIKNKKRKLGYI